MSHLPKQLSLKQKMNSTRVLVLLALLVRFAHCFSWDIIVGGDKKLYFYHNGTLKYTVKTPATRITSVTYDPLQYRVLFADVNYPNLSMYSFDISTRKTESLFTKTSDDHYVRVVYDAVTQSLVWKEGKFIYTFSLNDASYYKVVDGNLLLTLDHYCRDVAVDSYGGYIYWITDEEIGKAQLDGSDREVIVDIAVSLRLSLAIDQEAKRLYWIDHRFDHVNNHIYLKDGYQMSIESSDFNGKNRTTLYTAQKGSLASSLAVSKDFIYWHNYNEVGTWQLPKKSSYRVARRLYLTSPSSHWFYQLIAANYKIKEQLQRTKMSECHRDLIPLRSKHESTDSICQNYCLKGNCSINAEGQPICSLKAEDFEETCEENKCYQYCLHNGVCSLNKTDEPVCRCTANYSGQRCEISICDKYCLQGNCSVSTKGQPKCSCEAGYSGERCEVTSHKNCSNNSTERCDVAITQADNCTDNSTQQLLEELRSEMMQLQRIVQLFSDKVDKYEATSKKEEREKNSSINGTRRKSPSGHRWRRGGAHFLETRGQIPRRAIERRNARRRAATPSAPMSFSGNRYFVQTIRSRT